MRLGFRYKMEQDEEKMLDKKGEGLKLSPEDQQKPRNWKRRLKRELHRSNLVFFHKLESFLSGTCQGLTSLDSRA